MTQDTFKLVGDTLSGRGLSFDVAALPVEASKQLAAIAEAAYRQGRSSALLTYDDRFDLSCAVEALRALAVIVGPNLTGDHHRHAADVIARLLHDQEPGA